MDSAAATSAGARSNAKTNFSINKIKLQQVWRKQDCSDSLDELLSKIWNGVHALRPMARKSARAIWCAGGVEAGDEDYEETYDCDPPRDPCGHSDLRRDLSPAGRPYGC